MITSRTAEALHAYAHASEARTATRHRLDVVDEPVLDYGARSLAAAVRATPMPTSQHVALARPTATAFKVGFGFAAGAALFRLIVTFWAIVGLLLFGATALSMID